MKWFFLFERNLQKAFQVLTDTTDSACILAARSLESIESSLKFEEQDETHPYYADEVKVIIEDPEFAAYRYAELRKEYSEISNAQNNIRRELDRILLGLRPHMDREYKAIGGILWHNDPEDDLKPVDFNFPL